MLYVHSLFLSMAACRGVASTIAFGGDSLESINPFVVMLSRLIIGIEFVSHGFPVDYDRNTYLK